MKLRAYSLRSDTHIRVHVIDYEAICLKPEEIRFPCGYVPFVGEITQLKNF